MSQSEQSYSSLDVPSGSIIGESSQEPVHNGENDNDSEQSITDRRPAGFSVAPASELIETVAAATDLFQVAKMAFVNDPVFYQFDVRDPRPVNVNSIKADVDGWKVSFVARRSQGLFDIIKISQDPEVIVFRRPKQIPRLLWKDSSQSGTMRDLSGFAGVRLGRLNR